MMNASKSITVSSVLPTEEKDCLPWLKEEVQKLKFSYTFFLKFNFFQAAEKSCESLLEFQSHFPNCFKFVSNLPEVTDVKFLEWPLCFALCGMVQDTLKVQENFDGISNRPMSIR